MAIKNKAQLDALKDLTPEDKADLSSLFDSIDERDAQISDLRKKSGDADEITRKNKDLEKLLKDKESLSAELQTKLNALTTVAPASPASDDFLPFAEIRADIENLLAGGASDQ